METEKTCLNCGKILRKGRSDMKYCDAQCRSGHNNLKLRETEAEVVRINSILRKNRSILKSLNPEGMTVIRKEYLLIAGFNFDYITNFWRAKNGNEYRFCYEFGYMNLDADKVRIVNKQQYMKNQ